MKVCTFFGHRDTPKDIEPVLRDTILDLIKNKNVKIFYVGNHGNFDTLTRKTIREIKKECPEINYNVVLAYMPKNTSDEDFSDTILPDGIEEVPRKFAVLWRNKWMLNKSDYVVTYVGYSWGGASKFKLLAEKQNKTVINLYEKM